MPEAPDVPFMTIAPTNIRDVIQKQIQQTVDKSVNDVTKLSVNNFDGRYIANYPADTELMSDDSGRFYHLAGISTSTDLTVVAP